MQEYRYDAFISYRHTEKDTAVAETLQHQLEHYRIPRRLRGKDGKRSLSRIFRDKNELPVTDSLDDTIRTALRESAFLIVICSPHTGESLWVQKEIEYFLETHERKSILTVLVEGEPENVIPEVLRTRELEVKDDSGEVKRIQENFEMLSADYRLKVREARHTELPRLASVMLGCSYQELLNRQSHRVRQQAAAAAVAAGFLFIVFFSQFVRLQRQNQKLNEYSTDLELINSEMACQQAQEKMNTGDVIGALEAVMSGLPSAENENRAYSQETARMLQNLAQPYPEDNVEYEAFGVFEMEDSIKQIQSAVIEDHRMFAAMDDSDLKVWEYLEEEQERPWRLVFDWKEFVEKYDSEESGYFSGGILYGFELLDNGILVLENSYGFFAYSVPTHQLLWLSEIDFGDFGRFFVNDEYIVCECYGVEYYSIELIDMQNGKTICDLVKSEESLEIKDCIFRNDSDESLVALLFDEVPDTGYVDIKAKLLVYDVDQNTSLPEENDLTFEDAGTGTDIYYGVKLLFTNDESLIVVTEMEELSGQGNNRIQMHKLNYRTNEWDIHFEAEPITCDNTFSGYYSDNFYFGDVGCDEEFDYNGRYFYLAFENKFLIFDETNGKADDLSYVCKSSVAACVDYEGRIYLLLKNGELVKTGYDEDQEEFYAYCDETSFSDFANNSIYNAEFSRSPDDVYISFGEESTKVIGYCTHNVFDQIGDFHQYQDSDRNYVSSSVIAADSSGNCILLDEINETMAEQEKYESGFALHSYQISSVDSSGGYRWKQSIELLNKEIGTLNYCGCCGDYVLLMSKLMQGGELSPETEQLTDDEKQISVSDLYQFIKVDMKTGEYNYFDPPDIKFLKNNDSYDVSVVCRDNSIYYCLDVYEQKTVISTSLKESFLYVAEINDKKTEWEKKYHTDGANIDLATLSPDGRFIARWNNGYVLMNIETAQETTISFSDETERYLDIVMWSTDGKRFCNAFRDEGYCAVYDIDGREEWRQSISEIVIEKEIGFEGSTVILRGKSKGERGLYFLNVDLKTGTFIPISYLKSDEVGTYIYNYIYNTSLELSNVERISYIDRSTMSIKLDEGIAIIDLSRPDPELKWFIPNAKAYSPETNTLFFDAGCCSLYTLDDLIKMAEKRRQLLIPDEESYYKEMQND